MKDKRIATLVVEFMNPANKQMRADILRNHQTGLAKHKIDPVQNALLEAMVSGPVLAKMVSEAGDSEFLGDPPAIDSTALNQMVQDFDAKGDEVFKRNGALAAGAVAQAASAYNADGVHIFDVEPKVLNQGVDTYFVIRGNGYEHDFSDPANTMPLVTFAPGNEPGNSPDAIPGTVTAISCDIDLNERVTVHVALPAAGDWRVLIRNKNESTWSGDFESKNKIRVLAP